MTFKFNDVDLETELVHLIEATGADKMSHVIVWATRSDGSIIYMSDNWEQITGIPYDSAIERGWAEYMDEIDLAHVDASRNNALDSNSPWSGNCTLVAPSGKRTPIIFHGSPIFSSTGARYWIGTSYDMSLFQKEKEGP